MKRKITIAILAPIVLIIVLWTATAVYAALTKTQNTELLGWTEVALGTIQESGEFDTSGAYAANLHIMCCISGTTAHLGTEIIIMEASSTADDDWSILTRFTCCVATAFKSDFGADEAAAQTVLSITNPATGNLDHDGKFIFIEHTGTIANCEIAYQIDNSGDEGDTITVTDGITHAQTAADSDVYTVDGAGSVVNNSAVYNGVISLPSSASRYKVLWNNNYGATGSTVHVMARGTKMTGI